MTDLGSRPTGFNVGPFLTDEPAPPEEVEWLSRIAARLEQPDGHICAWYHAPRARAKDSADEAECKESWRFVAYFGDSWETAGDGWAVVELGGDDPVSERDDAAIEAVWRQCIEDSRADHAQRKEAAQ